MIGGLRSSMGYCGSKGYSQIYGDKGSILWRITIQQGLKEVSMLPDVTNPPKESPKSTIII